MKLRKVVVITVICLISVAVFIGLRDNASAVTSDEIAEQIGALEEEKADLDAQLERLEQSVSQNVTQLIQMVAQKDAIDQQIVIIHQQIGNLNDQIRAYGILIADKQDEIEVAQQRLDSLRSISKARIRAMEERGDISYWSVIFEAESFSDFLDRLVIAQELIEADRRCIEKLSDMAQEIEDARKVLDSKKIDLQNMREELSQTQTSLQEKRDQSDAVLQELLAAGEEYKLLLQESEERQQALMEEIAQKENEYDRLAYEEWLATSIPETTPPQQETTPPVSAESWFTPVPYYILSSPFGMRYHPVLGIYRMHEGVDLACAMDTPIYATRSGIVTTTAYQEYGAGNYVQINHGDGYRSIYMHMTRYVVSPGESVQAGQIIGYVGSSGLSDGPHLHFGISYNGTYVNPMQFIG